MRTNATYFRCQPNRAHRVRGGFTLVELVIVILILGILATVAVPKILNTSQEAEATATLQHLESIVQAAENHYAQHGTWPSYTAAANAPGEFKGFLA